MSDYCNIFSAECKVACFTEDDVLKLHVDMDNDLEFAIGNRAVWVGKTAALDLANAIIDHYKKET